MISPLLNIQNTYYRNGAEGLMSFCSDSSFLHENGFRFFKVQDYLAVTIDRRWSLWAVHEFVTVGSDLTAFLSGSVKGGGVVLDVFRQSIFAQGISDFLGNFRSTVLLVSFAPGFVSLPCMTPSSAALETLFPAQNILRNTALLQFPRKSNERYLCTIGKMTGDIPIGLYACTKMLNHTYLWKKKKQISRNRQINPRLENLK